MTKWIVVALTLLASSANAEEEWVHPDSTMQWKIRSEDYRDARVQFWSRNRPGQTWGPYSVPNIVGIFTLDCKQDEIVCFGAWSDQAKWNWGLGQDGTGQGKGCARCCRRCDGSSEWVPLDGPPFLAI